jgi:hypothetical protein
MMLFLALKKSKNKKKMGQLSMLVHLFYFVDLNLMTLVNLSELFCFIKLKIFGL